jgi:propionyl-CoA synthetase
MVFLRKLVKRDLLRYSTADQSRFTQEYNESVKDPEAFWAKKAGLVEWFRRPDRTFDSSESPFNKWFVNGELNAAYNCVDVHVKNGFGEQVAIVHDSPLTGSMTKITFKQLQDEVSGWTAFSG